MNVFHKHLYSDLVPSACVIFILKDQILGFPGGAVVENLPANAGNVGSIPSWRTKIPHAAGQLSPRTTTTEPACCN